MARNIVIYQDEGVGTFGLQCLQRFFETENVTLAMADDVIGGRIFQDTDMFVMPGGADLPYCKKLNGKGNANIRAFVEKGGTYLGICAGAYYACREIEFHKGRSDEICEPRELSLIDARAIGSLPELAPYYDLTLQSAAIVPVRLEDGQIVQTLYHGGCTFEDIGGGVQILARYADSRPAIIARKNVILSGVHFEAGCGDLSSYPADNAQEEILAQALSNTLAANPADWKNILFKS